ncbi:ATP-binding protein [Flavobacterium branchiarum]|uniref:AAA family ATPase n=1 Tax=Flavobacterium branchiarum TaxID=1114870 RepID=A0ABV5FMQ4_9FLAO|nr:ATP-binding protein [Flavobacterium branchiarum]MDN3674349.1 ATP-binding protein [Flavobacterium branchiarum]
MNEYDKSFQNLLEFEKSYDEFKKMDLSETDTRSKILDKMLIDVLGWTEYDIEREGWIRVGYFDYEINTSSFQYVIEAKKNFVEFKLPEKGNEVNIKSIYAGNKEVIDQIRSYVVERSLSFGVITNGTQFIVGQFANTLGIDWKNQKCIFFKDLDDIKRNFDKFYDLLHRQSICRYGKIKINKTSNIGKTIVKDFPLKRKKVELVRNQISKQLVPIINQVFVEIYNTESLEGKKILTKCYVQNKDVKKYNSELGYIFSDEPPTFDSRIVPVQNTENTQNQIKEQIFNDVGFLPDPIILIGTAGAGKTTFIKYFTEVLLNNKNKSNRPFIYIDFRLFTSQIVRDTKFIYNSIIEQIENEYPELNLTKYNILKIIYKNEIDKKKQGTWSYLLNDEDKLNEAISKLIDENQSDSLKHLMKISEYLLHTCRKRMCIVFDNADQLDDADQKEVFLLGNSINRSLKSIVIISLREGYFYKWKNKPPFNAYQSIVYHITAPPYSDVIEKRIKYVMTQFNFQELSLRAENKLVTFQNGSLEHLFKNLYETLFNSKNSDVMEFLEETSYPNTRLGLEIFKSFLLSGHSKITEYMSFAYGIGEGIPIWEFFKSIALDSNFYYETNKSKIVNLFYPSKSNRNHFTKIRILNLLHLKLKNSSKRKEYFLISEITNEFIKAGYTIDIIEEELQELFDYKLISTSEYSEDIEEETTIDLNSMISITSTGVYYLKSLIGRFHYIDLILQDTPIYDDDFYNDLAKVFPDSEENGNRNLSQRKLSVEKFVDYLSSQELNDKKFLANFEDKEIMFNVSGKIFNSLKKDIEKIQKVIVREK